MESTPASVDMTTQHMFVEYDLMGLPYDELETPSQPLPLPGHSCNFDSTHCKYVTTTPVIEKYGIPAKVYSASSLIHSR